LSLSVQEFLTVREWRRRKTESVGVMKDKELELEETEASHTLGRGGEGHIRVREKWGGCKWYSSP
jgi:hypothetical protein